MDPARLAAKGDRPDGLGSLPQLQLDRTFAIYHSPDGEFFATDWHCTHEQAHLAEGIVDGHDIECPLHFGAFDYRSGIPTVAPACVTLKTYPLKVEDGCVFIDISES